MCLLSEAKVARKVLAEKTLFEIKGIISGDYSVFLYFFGRLECIGHSFAYVAHFVFLRESGFAPRELA
jgi:hypothetical protein